uniref:Uncharacterized protein n=1 Tax=Schlesneria paludicola TaxID=360056 RepID=A0A7C2PAX3_9PLAN
MRRLGTLIAVVAIASVSLGCQQLGLRSACGTAPGCGCTATSAACHCSAGQPACGAAAQAAPVPPIDGSSAPSGRYEDAPQKPPVAAPPTQRTAPPPPVDDARAPRPLIFQ